MLFYFLCIWIVSCGKPESQTYKLNDEQLARVLFDIHFADVMLPTITTHQQDSVKLLYWNRMEELYRMPEAEIREEIKKLESEPEKLKLIMERVKIMADSIQ